MESVLSQKYFLQALTGAHKKYLGKGGDLNELPSVGHLYISLKRSKSQKLPGKGQVTPLIHYPSKYKILGDISNNITGKFVR